MKYIEINNLMYNVSGDFVVIRYTERYRPHFTWLNTEMSY